MTREEETIRMLERLKNRINFEVTDSQKKMNALNLAIQAIKQIDKISDIIEGNIDHFDHDDAMDALYEIKRIIRE